MPKKLLASALLLALVAVLYGQFLWNPIVFDDLYFFMVDGDGEQPVSSYHFSWLALRSLPYATLAWTRAWFGLGLPGFRVGNLILHGAVVVALFFFLSSVLTAVAGESTKDRLEHHWAAFFSAALFALHPVATYAAGYLVQRTILLAALFSVLAMLTYVQASVRQNSGWLWLTAGFYYLAVFSKEHAVMLPAVLLVLTVLLHHDWPLQLRRRWPLFAVLALVAGFVVLSVRGVIGSVYEPNAESLLSQSGIKLAYPLSVMTQAWLFFKYLFLWLLPNPAWMSIDMREPFAPSLLSAYLAAVFAFLAWGWVAGWLLVRRGRAGLTGFAMLLPWLMFFTEFSSVRIQEVFVLYRSYLWAPGVFCLLAAFFCQLKARLAVAMLSLVVLAMMPISMDRLATLSQPVLLWDDAEKLVKGRTDLPGAARIYYNRGTEWMKIDRLDQAITDLKQAIALEPDFSQVHGNLGAAYFALGDWPKALDSFNQAIAIATRLGQPVSQASLRGRAQALKKLSAQHSVAQGL